MKHLLFSCNEFGHKHSRMWMSFDTVEQLDIYCLATTGEASQFTMFSQDGTRIYHYCIDVPIDIDKEHGPYPEMTTSGLLELLRG